MINGKNFMFYVECETLTGSVILPLCEYKSVQLQFQSEKGKARRPKNIKWNSYYYKGLDYTLSLDGLITYSDEEIQQQLIEVNGDLLEANGALVSIGGVPVSNFGGYFCLENALFDWKTIKWSFEGTNTPLKWRGEVLVDQLSASFSTSGLAEFSTVLQGNGEPDRFHTPPPTNLKLVSQSSTLTTEDAGSLSIAPVQQGNTWLAGITLTGNALPNGVYSLQLAGTSIAAYSVQIGDTLGSIAENIAELIKGTANILSAYSDDDSVYIETSTSKTLTASYAAHTGTLRSVSISYSSAVSYDFYRVLVKQGTHEWTVDVQGVQPTIILPTGSYEVSVAGMGADLQYSDYSDTIQITVS